jgi:hypothetical protein
MRLERVTDHREGIVELDEAIALTIDVLRANGARQYGYDLWPPQVARAFVEQQRNIQHHDRERIVREIVPVCMDAAWELCRRGLVRPGVKNIGEQAVPETGYSLTGAGREALANIDPANILVMQPGSLARTFATFEERFGDGFMQRASEAINCRNAEAWLACCAMAGAAAESILLALAITKTGDEPMVVNTYAQSGGRRKILNMIVGQLDQNRRDTLTTFTNIISLWRDEAAHGKATPLSTANADEALRQLLHMSQWVNREWANLV